MRKTTFWAAIVAGALMFVGVADRLIQTSARLKLRLPPQLKPVDAFQMMLNAKNLPSQEFEDFSLVFPSPSNPWTNLGYTPIPFIGEKRLARAWKRDSSWGDDSRRLS